MGLEFTGDYEVNTLCWKPVFRVFIHRLFIIAHGVKFLGFYFLTLSTSDFWGMASL